MNNLAVSSKAHFLRLFDVETSTKVFQVRANSDLLLNYHTCDIATNDGHAHNSHRSKIPRGTAALFTTETGYSAHCSVCALTAIFGFCKLNASDKVTSIRIGRIIKHTTCFQQVSSTSFSKLRIINLNRENFTTKYLRGHWVVGWLTVLHLRGQSFIFLVCPCLILH